mgnify:CR=1 FL=1
MFLNFLNIEKFCRNLKPVTSTESFNRQTGGFHTGGLFSEIIFGPVGTKDRKTAYSFIELNCYVVHPTAYRLLVQRIDRKVEKFLTAEKYFSVTPAGVLIEDENGVTGIQNFIKLFPKIKFRGETKDREKLIKVLQDTYKEGTLFIRKLPIIPPEFRPTQEIDGRQELDPLNNIYLSVLRRSVQIRSLKPSDALYDVMNAGVQRGVMEHDDFIRAKIGKKSGIIRGSLLGKRVDFSGRAVITVGPAIKINEIGLPLRLAVGLFEPFIIFQVMYVQKENLERLSTGIKTFLKAEVTVDSVKKILRSIKNNDKIPDDLYSLIFEATESAMKDRMVIAKRDPDLHALSMRGFTPVLIRGNTLQICPLQVKGFNADFDGDQIAVYHPLSDEAQKEIKEKMTRSFSGSSSTSMSYELSGEMFVGLFLLTKDKNLPTKSPISVSKADLDKLAVNPYEPVMFKGRNTTLGKAIINGCFPDDFKFIDEQLTKSRVQKILRELLLKYGDKITEDAAYKLGQIGFRYVTMFGPSVSLDQLEIPKEIYELKKRLDSATTEQAQEVLDKMRSIIMKEFKDTPIFDIIESGSSRGWDQPMQILAAKGIIADPEGKILKPIKNSFVDGMSPTQYFQMGYGARMGIINRVINTSDTGYMSRKLVYLLNSVEVHPNLKDCGTTKYINLKLDNNIISRLDHRFIYDRGVKEFERNAHTIGETIKLRSPIYCISPKICHTCYGYLTLKHRTPFVGVLAGQVIGERGTQLIMRAFHTGGAVKITKRKVLDEILDNNPTLDSKVLSSCVKQEESDLVALKKFKVTFDMSFYEEGENLSLEEAKLRVRSLIATFTFEDGVSFEVILDYPVEFVANTVIKSSEKIILEYKKDDTIFTIPLDTGEVREQILYVERLISGREIFKDVDHLLMKLIKIYSPPVADMDLVHLEVLISQCLRHKDNTTLPARLALAKGKFTPVLGNIKKDIFSSGFLQGLAFENIGQAITTGLTSEKTSPSIIERIMTGELVEKKEEKRW